MPRPKVIPTSLNIELRAGDDDVVVFVKAADKIVRLPKATHAALGMRVTVVQRAVSSGTGVAIDPADTDVILGQTIAGVAISGAAGKKLINTGATDVLGDRAELTCDGDGKWYITGLQGVWAAEA